MTKAAYTGGFCCFPGYSNTYLQFCMRCDCYFDFNKFKSNTKLRLMV